MKKKLLFMTLLFLMAVTAVGCGNQKSEDASLEKQKKESSKEDTKEDASATKTEESKNVIFQELSKRGFTFSSGAGGWSEEFVIEEDGSFSGNYHDSDMGSTGEGYDGGTRYSASYSGYFSEPVKINDYTYKMKMTDITYEQPDKKEEIVDNIRYIYTTSYCLGGTDTFTIYLPGTPVSALSQEVYSWISMGNQSETELTAMVIADESNGYGIFSYERITPLEDAKDSSLK